MKKFISALSTFAVFMSLASVASAADNTVLRNATSDLDYVYTVINANGNSTIVDRTDQAEMADNDSLPAFLDTGSKDEYLYMGMSSEKFDLITFRVNEEGKYDSSGSLAWQYNDNGSWKNLAVNQGVDAFRSTGTATLQYNMPADWDKGSFEGKSAYWVRVSPNSIVRKSAFIDQISARAFNFHLNVQDKHGRDVADLSESDFDISGGSDNQIYGFANVGNGGYDFSLQAEGYDTTYIVIIDDVRYSKKSITTNNVGSNLMTYNVTLTDENDVYFADEDNNDEDCDMPFKDLYGSFAKSEIEDLYCRGIVSGRSYYYYEPNDQVSRAEFLKMALLNAGIDVSKYKSYKESFDDVDSNDWYRNYVIAGVKLDVIDDEDEFNPNDEINRAEAVAMLVRLADENTSGSYVPFSDVSSNSWYAKYIRTAYYDGVVEGYTDGKFRPGNDLTRAEAAVMVDNAYKAWY